MLAPPGSKPNIAFPRGFGSPPPPTGQAPRPVTAPAASNSDLNPDGLYNTQRAPDWTVIQGASGPQWVYKSWHLVFTRKGDKPGSAAHDGAGDLTWTASDATAVAILADGAPDRRRLRARAPGRTTVTVALGDLRTTLDVEVVP